MRVVILTGPLGVGKTYLQQRLRQRGFWSPDTVTTRAVADSERETQHVAWDHFRQGVTSGEFVLPATFGGAWYAWRREELDKLADSSDALAVANVRPYTALTLSILLPAARPVWLWLTERELQDRRGTRKAERDTNDERLAADVADRAYEALFADRVRADEGAEETILNIARGIATAPPRNDLVDVRAIQAHQQHFSEARGWLKYHSAKNVAAALTVEAAELLEVLQWNREEEATALCRENRDVRAAVSAELADVLIYAFYFALIADIDVQDAIWRKFATNAQKHAIHIGNRSEAK